MDTVRFETRKPLSAWSVVWLLMLLPSLAPAAGAQDQPVLCEEPEPGGQELPVVYLDAVADAVHQVALDAGVALCLADGATDPAFDQICAAGSEAREELYRLRWKADLNVTQAQPSRQAVIVTLAIDVYHAGEGEEEARRMPPPKNVMQQVDVFASADYSAARREDLIGAAIYDTILNNDDILRWFLELGDFEALLLPRPEGRFPPPPVSRYAEIEPEPEPAPAETAAERLQRWQAEKDRIADLLIADQAIAARESAAALLQEEGLPEDVARRVRELHDVAVEKAAAQAAETAEVAEAEAPPPPAPQEPPPLLDVMFEVRYAPTGSGFRAGIDGKLYISYRDIRFVPADSDEGDGWSVKWPTLAGFGEAAGVWDVSHPLFIETESGEKYYVTERLKNGRYGKGRKILDYLDRGRKTARGGSAT